MFILHCPHCDADHLVTNVHIQSVHRTSEGMIGYVRCAQNHTVIHRFPPVYPPPPAPPSVVALQVARRKENAEAPRPETQAQTA